MTRWLYLCILLTATAFAGSFYVQNYRYDDLPDQVPIHWNIEGRPDGFVPKNDAFMAFWLMPSIMVSMIGLTLLLPWLSPRHFEVDSFRNVFGYVMAVLVALMGYIHLIVLGGSLHPELAMDRMLIGGICLFFLLVGAVLGKVRRNFWMGVRTPWTLANEEVWDQTHRVAGKLFLAGGILGVLAALVGLPLYLAFIGIMAAALVPVVYSLVLYKKLQSQGRV
jgi:uncharacterized membrane protein